MARKYSIGPAAGHEQAVLGRRVEWLPKRRSSRIVCTILQVLIQRLNGQQKLLVEHPWRDAPAPVPFQHPVLAELDKIRGWQADLKAGQVRSFAALAKREGITTARVSQLMRLTRLSAGCSSILREQLEDWRGSNETFSLRKLQQIVSLSDEDQCAAVRVMACVVRLRGRQCKFNGGPAVGVWTSP
jgi:hypothetical protein